MCKRASTRGVNRFGTSGADGRMGLVLDSSVPVASERKGLPVSALLVALQEQHEETEIVVSAISVVELAWQPSGARSTPASNRRDSA
jgi:hypothetical protein